MSELLKKSVTNVHSMIKNVFGTPKKVGLALGGGGARGIAHIGVIKVLASYKVPISCIAGTSSGALFGALFSGGMSPHDMAREAKLAGWVKLVRFKLSKTGPIFGEGIEDLITSNIGKKDISDLRIPLAVVATDLRNGEKVVIRKGDLAKAVHASSAIPGLFSPVVFEGRLLCDGLVIDNVPVREVKDMGADFVIAVDVVPNVTLSNWQPNLFSVIERALDISCRKESTESKKLADIVIDPVKLNISALSINESDTLIKMGEDAAEAAMPAIKKALKIS